MFDVILEVAVGAYNFSPFGLVVLTCVFFLIFVDCYRILMRLRKLDKK